MTGDDTSALPELQAIAGEAFALLDTGRQIPPFSARLSAFDLDDAYRVTAAIKQMREMRGEIPVGRKIGFTNRTIWAQYNVYGPVWGYVYDRTVHNLAEIGDTFSLTGLAEPRIEPEIVFKLAFFRSKQDFARGPPTDPSELNCAESFALFRAFLPSSLRNHTVTIQSLGWKG